ncbi:hypothetical protein LB572_01045 [Mesorhizobium sp. BH1-1-5]|uniref:hypothetical protein n=1 Tax=Mesorhizobium sp. BH1-1-5 TaxID=2876661 RepID=UPI001CCCE498|nr:hypothetical protein [Mesorhizobium sp. BH1-1-5]MBZ9985675.1 hypothetical protein [Mesorhizobium sp. BH1-1-5]
MKAIVEKEFVGRRDDHGESETFKVGAEIEGNLADVAVREKLATEIAADETTDDAKPSKGRRGK